MKLLIGLSLFMIFLFIAAAHFYWGLGGKWGAQAAVPSNQKGEKVLKPTVLECFIVATGLLSLGIFVLIRVELIPVYLPPWLLGYGLWFISLIFILRAIGEFKYIGFFKKIRNTAFSNLDDKYYSPLCLLIGVLGIILQRL